MRIFTALRLPPDIVRDITRVQRGVAGAKWVSPDKLHITTAFYGDINEDQAELLDEALMRRPFNSFELQLEGAGHFGSLNPRAIWLGVKPSAQLEGLHERCRNAARQAGIVMEKRNYMPHVTLAYLRQDPPLDRIIAFEKRLGRFNTKPFLIDQMHMISSWRKEKGGMNVYRDEASYPFLGGY